MRFTVDSRDIELWTSASYGFKGFFDENGNDDYSQEMYDKAMNFSDVWLNKIYKAKTLDDMINGIPTKIPYSLEIKNNVVILNWTCPNGLVGEYQWGFEVTFAQIQ